MRWRRHFLQKWLLSLSLFLSYRPLISFFSDYPCAHHNSLTIWNIWMKIHSNVHEINTVCHVQKWLLSLSYFLSYFPLIKFLTNLMSTISRLPYGITWWNFVAIMCMRLRGCVTYKKWLLPLSQFQSYFPVLLRSEHCDWSMSIMRLVCHVGSTTADVILNYFIFFHALHIYNIK